MAKKMTLEQQAKEALMKVKPHNGRYVYAPEAWVLGWRARGRADAAVTKAERRALRAFEAWGKTGFNITLFHEYTEAQEAFKALLKARSAK
jgi:hypothetical protein